MAYYVLIGPIAKNKSGMGARGYQLFRRGPVVIRRWGAVDVSNRQPFWRPGSPKEKRETYRSVSRAQQRYRELVRQREDESYERLPAGRRIR